MKNFLKKIHLLINEYCAEIIVGITFLIPIIMFLYILNVHGYIIKEDIIFRLDIYYKYFMYILAFFYIYEKIYLKEKFQLDEILIIIFMIITVISTFTAYDFKTALLGYTGRFEGLYTLLFYGTLYLNTKRLKDEKIIKTILITILFTIIIHFIFVILQVSGLYLKMFYLYKTSYIIGLCENANFLSTLASTITMLSLGLYLTNNKKKYIWLTLFVISYITLLLANSTGPFISLIFTFILFIIWLIIKKKIDYKKVLVISLLMIILYPIILSKNDLITPEIKSNINYIFSINKNNDIILEDNEQKEENITYNSITDLGHGRIRIWKQVWKLIIKKPLIGYGPDNLGLVYEKAIDDTGIADKAHNIYLNIWVSSGLFALISYIMFITIIIIKGLKSKNNLVIILTFTIILYSIQGLFNINVNEVTPYFYLLLGLAMGIIDNKLNIEL